MGSYVLEIAMQDETLRMCIFEQNELALTLKHYSQLSISSRQINGLCQETLSILNKANQKSSQSSELIGQLKKNGQFLWDFLFTRQVKTKLVSNVIKDLVLSLDEELIDIPWELLYDGSDFFCLKFNLGRVVRTKEHLHPVQYRSINSALKMLILADPRGDLKSAYYEGVYIKNQFERKQNQIRIDFKSTNIDTLYVKKNLRDYDIVHFAGHSEFESRNPQNTGWLLSDGKFTAKDILALSQSLSLPSLVFSNACNSARTITKPMDTGYQEKTYSLASAFLFSGVRHYIGTIWRIEDPVSLTFAKEFYNRLIEAKSIGEAIRLARLKLIKDYSKNSLVWAGYILYGDPNFTLFGRKYASHQQSYFKITKPFSLFSKKLKIKVSLFFLVILIAFPLYIAAPIKNPNSYFLFLKSLELSRKGRNYEAVMICNEIIGKDPLFLNVYPFLADNYEKMGKRNDSLKYYFEYAFYSQKKNDRKNLASAYVGIGWTYQLLGDYSKAFDFFNKAASVASGNNDRLNEAIALRKLAVWHIDKNNYDRAVELLMKSSEINRDRQSLSDHRYNLACDYFDIALVFSDKDDFNTAKEFYKKSRALFEKMRLKSELSDYYFNLGELYLFEKEYSKALDYYEKGLNIDKLHNNKPSISSDYNMLGELYMAMDNFAEAEKNYLQAVSVAKEIQIMPELADSCHNLGLLYKRKGDKLKAAEFIGKSLEIYSQMDTPRYKEVQEDLADLSKK